MAEEKSKALIPNPAMLELYSAIDPALPMFIVKAAIRSNSEEYRFALTMGYFGFVLAVLILGGAIYLAMNKHDWVAAALLGTGTATVITGFQFARLSGSTIPEKLKTSAKTKGVLKDALGSE